jgi:DNA-directed RNA polymerase II subunit RPB2
MADPVLNSKELSRHLIDKYFTTVLYPYTKHHIDSYDTFLKQDLIGIIRANNPILILKDLIDEQKNIYKYKVEIYVGGREGTAIQIGTPTVSLQNTQDVRVLYPNEARLRNLTYGSTIFADIIVKITYTPEKNAKARDISPTEDMFTSWPLCTMPIMLHSSFCILHNKPKEFLKQAGECPYDNGGYFIVDGAEKVLITRQEQAFNTLYISTPNDPKQTIFAAIQCISTESRAVKRVAFAVTRYSRNMQKKIVTHETVQVILPFVRKPLPLFVLFRALGFQSDEEILHLIFPDFDSPEAQALISKLHASIIQAHPFLTTFTAINYIKTLTKGFSVEHVIDILRNQLFIHMPNDPTAQAIFLGECVRKILRVSEGYDAKTDRDDTRNQRCLTSGFLIQELFNNSYKVWSKAIRYAIDTEYNYNKATLYANDNFQNIFAQSNQNKIFLPDVLRNMIMKGFKGKWGTGMGEEKSGVLQSLSRLSYVDFMSHCRRVILDFDTSMKLTGPRKLHTTQYGYFCTSETPTGGSIGITKNLSIMTAISTSTKSREFIEWLHRKGGVHKPVDVTLEERIIFVPVYLNGGIMGYTAHPVDLTNVLKLFKRTGCLPYSVSVVFSMRDRAVYIYMDAGRPLRPLIWLPTGKVDVRDKFEGQYKKLMGLPTWRDLVLGRIKLRENIGLDSNRADSVVMNNVSIDSTVFLDPYVTKPDITLEQYIKALEPYTGAIEYVDPYEQNETYIANYVHDIKPETTHIEVHPSTIMSMMTSMIPFAPHNQSPRNQLSCSQSKQGVSVYATNWRNRFDNSAHVLCYGEAPLVRTIYNNYLGEGNMVYGMNCILAIACWSGYNQEDGIVMNYDAVQRGMFRTMSYRSYEAFEEDDKMTNTKVRFANPASVGDWKDLRPGLDYSKLDDNGIIREGEYVDETTVIVGAYLQTMLDNKKKDASTCPQVWTRGRVEKVAVMINNAGLRLIKIRVVQDRIPELGDKFSNRHGQKGTIGALLRGHDMPRTQSGIVPDMIMNPHAIPSRMTIAQNLEQLLGKAGLQAGAYGDGTSFMNSESPQDDIGHILEANDFERYGNEVMYNGATGEQITMAIFIGPVYGMRLKHMVDDKWQARGKGRKESRTHQPTAGRGAQGGLKIGEMDRDAIVGHGVAGFFKEAFMERSDGAKIPICVSCGTVPIYNPQMNITVCSMCDGPLRYSGTDNVNTIELLPPLGRPKSRIVQVEMPYATKLLAQEQETFLNMAMRFITTNGVEMLRPLERIGEVDEEDEELIPVAVLPPVQASTYVDSEEPKLTTVQLKSVEAAIEQERDQEQAMETPILDDLGEMEDMDAPVININLQPMGPNMGPNMRQMGQMEQMEPNPMGQMGQPMSQMGQMGQMGPNPMGQMGQMNQMMGLESLEMPNQMPQQTQVQMNMPQQTQVPIQTQVPMNMPQQMQQMQPQMGGAHMLSPATYQSNPIIAIDTSPMAMQMDGIDFMGGRRLRRGGAQINIGGMGQMGQMGQGQMGQMGQMGQGQGQMRPMGASLSTGALTVTKLE